MERLHTQERNNWKKSLENKGFGYHSLDGIPYWNEGAYYKFSSDEIDEIEIATNELWDMCLEAVQHIIDNKLYSKLGIPSDAIPLIEKSWEEDAPSIYGRFDLAMNNGQIKMLEFNADTPTSLFEAGVIQWFWLQDKFPKSDQFNSIHEALIEYWKFLKNYLNPGKLHFSCLRDSLEDLTNVEYLRDCAIQAGINTEFLLIDEIGWADDENIFVDNNNERINNIFKLYAWEWLMEDSFSKNLNIDKNCLWIEPAWKMILSNKAILPILWELFPNNKYLLPSYFNSNGLSSYVKKPYLSREGANVEIIKDSSVVAMSLGSYGKEGYIFQQYFELPNFNGFYPIIGSWVIGQKSVGIGIRESKSIITDNMSMFVPHIF